MLSMLIDIDISFYEFTHIINILKCPFRARKKYISNHSHWGTWLVKYPTGLKFLHCFRELGNSLSATDRVTLAIGNNEQAANYYQGKSTQKVA